jgi:inner membrane protein
MSPITHFLVGWVALERLQASNRDRALVALAGVAPDLDGLGIVIDFATRQLQMPPTDFYQQFHRLYGHGLAPALMIAAVCSIFASRSTVVALCAFVSVHLHLACDLLGSRGSTPDDIWGVWYFAPFSTAHGLSWHGQWPLVGWQNMLITAVLLGMALERAARIGYSPLVLVSPRGDAVLVNVLRKWRASVASDATTASKSDN